MLPSQHPWFHLSIALKPDASNLRLAESRFPAFNTSQTGLNLSVSWQMDFWGKFRRATEAGVFVEIERLQKDVQAFFAFPIPRTIWDKIKPFQDEDFVEFIERCLRPVTSALQRRF